MTELTTIRTTQLTHIIEFLTIESIPTIESIQTTARILTTESIRTTARTTEFV